MNRISRDEFYMEVARLASKRSTCLKPNGAALVIGKGILIIGYAGAPPGLPHCIDVGSCNYPPSGPKHCQRTIHAEINVILKAAEWGIPAKGGTLYCTTAPCPLCSKALSNSGIQKVVYENPYSNMTGIFQYLKPCGIEVVQYNGK